MPAAYKQAVVGNGAVGAINSFRPPVVPTTSRLVDSHCKSGDASETRELRSSEALLARKIGAFGLARGMPAW